ncbi:MAG TPA: hypothetical protein VK191_09805 [Symbiobacteriaceae bacterium]|nr:hypothetical protein [Symbiobacteriaceae bacterium]
MKSHLCTRGISLALLAVLAMPSAALAEPGSLTRTEEQTTATEIRGHEHQAPVQQAPAQEAPARQAPPPAPTPAPAPMPAPMPAPAPPPPPAQQEPAQEQVPPPAPAPAPIPAPAPPPPQQAPAQEVKPEAPKRVRKWGFLRLRRRESGEIQGTEQGGGGGCGGRPCGNGRR